MYLISHTTGVRCYSMFIRTLGNFTKGIISRRTIRAEIMAALILTALITAFIVNINYYVKTNSYIKEKVIQYNQEIIKQAGQKLDYILSQVETAKVQLIAASVTSNLFRSYRSMSPADKIKTVKSTEDLLKYTRRSFPIISDIYMIGYDGTIYSTSPNTNKEKLGRKPWIRSMMNLSYNQLIIPTHIIDYENITYPNNSSMQVVSVLQKVRGTNGEKNTGIIQIDIKYSEVEKVAKSVKVGEGGFLFIADDNNMLIYFPDQKYLGKSLETVNYKGYNSQNTNHFSNMDSYSQMLAFNYNITNNGWRVVGIIPSRDLFWEIKEVNNIWILVTVIAIIFSLILSYFISKGMTRQFNRLIKGMKRAGEGQLDILVPEGGNSEMQFLSKSYNVMIDRIDTLMKDIIKKEKEKTQLELKALQAQINPHFVYNTLNTIKWMALMEKSDNIANAIVSLVKILEYSSKNCDRTVPVREELDFIRNYIYIQKLRYGNEIGVHYEIDSDMYNYCILKFILQPVIENSIIHGFQGSNHAGIISIRGRKYDSTIIFEIEDNGIGMDMPRKEKFTGLGINNIDTRIKLNFGLHYGIKISSVPGEGTLVVITLPILTGQEEYNV